MAIPVSTTPDAQPADPVQGSEHFLDYGALGLVAFVFLTGLVVLGRMLRDAYNREKERADKLEEKLLQQNELIRDRFAGDLAKATEAMRDFIKVLDRAERDRYGRP